ncbi:N-acetylmuramidase domain-containing protein [Paraburkholderia sp. BL17N1]|uniref:N-acetylmuramidase domain-containing protein n=1 Tax=Paraburkholderia sp. BL17N1 TaxID=1938798 RepID=UPI000F10AE34|nr:N-acetylmuramidase domain-containing protein [Paraburkholderia sp. BL17N1]RKR37592.1 uncharacterized protein DUF3380 [Paraburkholderia sp. BL17N1]
MKGRGDCVVVEAEAKKARQAADKQSKGKKKKLGNPYPGYPDLCFPVLGRYGLEGLHQYKKVVRASTLDFEAALKSCSWGGFQILGEYFLKCGCSSVFEFANKFMSGTNGQVEIFVAFMKNIKPDAIDGLRERKWEKVAASYNGSNWKKYNPHYVEHLGKYYEKFK